MDAEAPPGQVVGEAIQNLTARRLGRGFLPLAALSVTGLAELLLLGPERPGAWLLFLGAPLTAGAMLAYGLRGVQLAFGREPRPWMTGAAVASLVPLAFGLYVLGWRGLRTMAEGGGSSLAWGALLAFLGGWTLRGWLRVLEVRRLADAMAGIGTLEGGWDR